MNSNYHYTESEIKEILNSRVILIDTREKRNEHIIDYLDSKKIAYKQKALKSGDYSIMIPRNDKLAIFRDIYFDEKIIIERKANLNELSGNLAQERERFENEFTRSDALKFLLVENATISAIINHTYNTQFKPASYLASIISFQIKYRELKTIFIPEQEAGIMINVITYQYLKQILKKGD